jgi:lipocalin
MAPLGLRCWASLAAAELAVILAAATADTCAPVMTQPAFDLRAYASKRWYIQQQMATSYLPASQNFCVYADYTLLSKPNFWGFSVQVHNYAQEKDGTAHDSGNSICARVTNSSDPAKLEVGPCFLPRVSGFTTGPYWVLAYSEEDGYALISGGQPNIKGSGGCRTGSGVNGAGLWVFTRQRQRDERLVQKVRGLAEAQGFDLSVLADVDQTGCDTPDLHV